MSRDHIDQARAKLANLDGPVRVPALVELGQALMAECTRLGPAGPAAKPDLDASIDAFDEAYGYLDTGDPARAQIAGLLGFQLTNRFGAHGGAERDRETAIHVLEEALSFPDLPVQLRGITRLSLGQLYLTRTVGSLQTGGFSVLARSGQAAPAEAVADADRAGACLRAVIDDDAIGDEFTVIARTLLEMTEAVRAMFDAMGGDLATFDLNRLSRVFTMLQGMQARMQQQGPVGYRLPAADLIPMAGTTLASLDPLDRPVAVVQGRQTADVGASPIERRTPPPPAPPDAAELRRSLHALLSPASGEEEIWNSAAELLRPGAPAPDAATADEMVALASTISELAPRPDPAGGSDSGGEPDPAAAAIDAYLLAVTLLLRGRAGGDSDGADRRAGSEELLAAAQAIPLDHPAAMVILRSLGAFLREARPLDDVVTGIAGKYADRLDRAIATGVAEPEDLVTLHALRCLCRAAEVLAELRQATRVVPAEYPWLAPIKAASEFTVPTSGSE